VYVLRQNCRAAGWWRVKSVIVYVLRQSCRAAGWWRVKMMYLNAMETKYVHGNLAWKKKKKTSIIQRKD
jgi:hypothetical protein